MLRAACCSLPPRWQTGCTRTPQIPAHTQIIYLICYNTNQVGVKTKMGLLFGTFLGHTAAPTSGNTVAPPAATSVICSTRRNYGDNIYTFDAGGGRFLWPAGFIVGASDWFINSCQGWNDRGTDPPAGGERGAVIKKPRLLLCELRGAVIKKPRLLRELRTFSFMELQLDALKSPPIHLGGRLSWNKWWK